MPPPVIVPATPEVTTLIVLTALTAALQVPLATLFTKNSESTEYPIFSMVKKSPLTSDTVAKPAIAD
jgi:hypothetical protein